MGSFPPFSSLPELQAHRTLTTLYSLSIFGSLCLPDGKGNGTPLQYSCLENPMDGGAGKAGVHGVTEGWTRLSDFTFTFHFHALEKEMATHSSVLAWRIPGTVVAPSWTRLKRLSSSSSSSTPPGSSLSFYLILQISAQQMPSLSTMTKSNPPFHALCPLFFLFFKDFKCIFLAFSELLKLPAS